MAKKQNSNAVPAEAEPYKPKPSARIFLPGGDHPSAKNIKVGEKIRAIVTGKVTSVSIDEYGDKGLRVSMEPMTAVFSAPRASKKSIDDAVTASAKKVE